jgi:phage gpG-like protein
MENFRRGAFDGQTWPSLQPSTAKAYVQHRRRGTGPGSPGRRRRGYANLLHPTGRHLLNRLHASHTNVEARVLVAQPWAHVHNFGLPMKYFTMPKRTFLGFSRQDLHDLEAAILRYGEREALGGLR